VHPRQPAAQTLHCKLLVLIQVLLSLVIQREEEGKDRKKWESEAAALT
jgi:hypothetical protein